MRTIEVHQLMCTCDAAVMRPDPKESRLTTTQSLCINLNVITLPQKAPQNQFCETFFQPKILGEKKKKMIGMIKICAGLKIAVLCGDQ